MSEQEQKLKVSITRLEGDTMAGVRAELSGPDGVGAVIGEMFATAAEKIAAAGGTPGTAISLYDMDPEHPENGLVFVVGNLFDEGPVDGLQLVDLPATQAAVVEYRGSMASIGQSWRALEEWLAGQEQWVASGPSRELYVNADPSVPQEEWVTVLQQPVKPRVAAEGEHLQEDEPELTGEETADDSSTSEAEEGAGAENDAEDAPKTAEPGA